MSDLISVIVPVYKVEEYLEACVESIKNQSYQKLEIILVDDGSPDNCGAMCDELAKTDERIRVLHKPNGGLSDARNAGLAVAKGKYIGFVDSDDTIEASMYADLYEAIEVNNADISVCCVRKIYSNKQIDQDVVRDKRYSKRKAVYEIINGENVESFAWNKLYRRELFEGIEFPVGRIFEDMLFIPQLFQRANLVVHVNKLDYNYMRRDDSILGTWNLKTQAEFTHAQQDRFNFLAPLWPEFIPLMMVKYKHSLEDLGKKVLKAEAEELKTCEPLFKKELGPFFKENEKYFVGMVPAKVLVKYKILTQDPFLFRRLWKPYYKVTNITKKLKKRK